MPSEEKQKLTEAGHSASEKPTNASTKDVKQPQASQKVAAAPTTTDLGSAAIPNRRSKATAAMGKSPSGATPTALQRLSKSSCDDSAQIQVDGDDLDTGGCCGCCPSLSGAVWEGANKFAQHAGADVKKDLAKENPQVGFLWGKADFEGLENELKTKDKDLEICCSKALPKEDKWLCIIQWRAKKLSEFKDSSCAAELESLRLRVLNIVSPLAKQEKTEYYIWALHDYKFNQVLLTKALSGQAAITDKGDDGRGGNGCITRLLIWLGLYFGEGDVLAILQAHFGSDTALTFLFTLNYVFALWPLAIVGLIMHIIKSDDKLLGDLDYYREVWSPLFLFILFFWSLFYIRKWRGRLDDVGKTWMGDIIQDDADAVKEKNDSFKPWNEENPDYYPTIMRIIWTLPIVPILIVDIILMMSILLFVFWAEMWIVFEWGQCSRINAENNNSECRGADVQWGILGVLFEMVPGIVEAIFFEILLALSKAMANLAVWLQNWRLESEQEMAYIAQVVVFELIGKFGWIFMLGIGFVPDWTEVTQDCNNFDVTAGNQCWGNALENIDTWYFGLIGLKEQSFSCLKVRTCYDTRLLLFETAVAAPFMVAQIVNLAIKTLVPMIVLRCRACNPNDHSTRGGCYFRCCRILLRFLSCICLFDVEQVGYNECTYLARGDLIGEELFLELCADEGLTERDPAAVCKPAAKHALLSAWKQGMRDSFRTMEENLETSMHAFWLMSFAVVYPLGVILALSVYLFEIRADMLRMCQVQKRSFRKHFNASLAWVSTFMVKSVSASIIFNAIIQYVTYSQVARWRPEKYPIKKGLLYYKWHLVAAVFGSAISLLFLQNRLTQGKAILDIQILGGIRRGSNKSTASRTTAPGHKGSQHHKSTAEKRHTGMPAVQVLGKRSVQMEKE